MAESLKKYYNDLFEIRKYLVKIGPQRRQTGNITAKKFKEANILLHNSESIISNISNEIDNFDENELIIINSVIEKIRNLFEDIKFLCCVPNMTDVPTDDIVNKESEKYY